MQLLRSLGTPTFWLVGCLLACEAKQSDDADASTGGVASVPGAGGSGVSSVPPGTGGAVSIDIGVGGKSVGVAGTVNGNPDDHPYGIKPIEKDQAERLLGDQGNSCAKWAGEAEPNSVLEFIVDVSWSMNAATPATGGLSKWVVTQRALHSAISSLPTRQPVGLTFFPNMDIVVSSSPRPASACVDTTANVAIGRLEPDSVHRDELLSTLDGLQLHRYAATPTHDAYNVGLAELKASSEPGEKYLVLITDGQPTQSLGCIGPGIPCEPVSSTPIIEAIEKAKSQDGIKTYVVGSPGSELSECTKADVRDWLSAAARSGGTDSPGCNDKSAPFCHFDLSQASDFGQALSTALGSIVGSIACDWAVPAPPNGQTIDPDLVSVVYADGGGDYSLVLQNRAKDCAKGWAFADDAKTKIRICAETCDHLRQNPRAKLSLVFGCTQEQITTPLL